MPAIKNLTRAILLLTGILLLSGCAFFQRSLAESQRQQAREDYKSGAIDQTTYAENMRRADASDERAADNDKVVSPDDVRRAQDEAH